MFHALNSSSVEITPIRKVPLMMKMMKMMVCAGPVLHAADGRLLCMNDLQDVRSTYAFKMEQGIPS